MEYDDMRAMEKTHVCSECGGELVITWDKENNCYRLCCGYNHSHNGFQRKLSETQVIKRGQLDTEHGTGAQKDLEERAKRSETALSLLPKEDIATKRALGLAEIGNLVLWADKIGLTAQLGHICLYFGKPYVTVDGYYYLNNKRKKPVRIGTRPMTTEEKTAYMVDDATHAYIAEAWLGGVKLPDIGEGYVTRDEVELKSDRNPAQFRAPVVHGHPQRMAEKRAEWQLLRKLIPLEVKE